MFSGWWMRTDWLLKSKLVCKPRNKSTPCQTSEQKPTIAGGVRTSWEERPFTVNAAKYSQGPFAPNSSRHKHTSTKCPSCRIWVASGSPLNPEHRQSTQDLATWCFHKFLSFSAAACCEKSSLHSARWLALVWPPPNLIWQIKGWRDWEWRITRMFPVTENGKDDRTD